MRQWHQLRWSQPKVDQSRAEMEMGRVAVASIWAWRKLTQVRPASIRAMEGGGSKARASLPMQESS